MRRVCVVYLVGGMLFACAEGRTDSTDSTAALIRHADGRPGEYIVVLDHDAFARTSRAELDAAVDRLSSSYGATVRTRYTSALRGFAADMAESDALALAADSRVAYVEENGVASVTAVQTDATWGLDRVDQAELPLDGSYHQLGQGLGTTIYVVDTGIRSTHAEFTGRVKPGFSAITDGGGTEDCFYHGTHVSGTAVGTTYGIAKLADVVPVRVLDCTGNGSLEQVIAGLDWVAANHVSPAVANLSLTFGSGYATVDQAISTLVADGVTVVVAAGNNMLDGCLFSPGREPRAITVGSTTNTDARSGFSNWGSCLDIFAPGTDITSAGITNDSATKTVSGTSFASPHVAGAAAVYLGMHPTATPAEVTGALLGDATTGVVTGLNGSPDRLLHISAADTTPPVVSIVSPVDGAEVMPSFTVVVSAMDDNLRSVALAIDGAVVETKTAGPFQFQVSALAAGAHTLTATATDLAELSTSASATVTVTAPELGLGGSSDGPVDGNDEDPDGGGCATSSRSGGLVLALFWIGLWRRRVPRPRH